VQVFMFPGQGAQKRGMGRDLFDEVPEFAELESAIDATLGYSVRRLCLEDPGGKLRDTRYTQPALYTVNALYYYKARRAGLQPQFLAGHSLGEYNALLAAGVFDFMTGLHIVRTRGELMASAGKGAMSAVIGLSGPRVLEILREKELETLDIATYNSGSQTVVAGPNSSIEAATRHLLGAGASMCVPLPVSAAFHSRYMAPAAAQLAACLEPCVFRKPSTVVISNVTAEPHPNHDSCSAAIKSLLIRQMTEPVRWWQSVQHLLSRGATSFVELGPGTVLARLVHEIRQQH
jgi:malonyl CoA-acyl carrier protein transacylase